MVRVTSLLIIAARALTEMKIMCVVGMHMLKVDEYNLGVKGVYT